MDTVEVLVADISIVVLVLVLVVVVSIVVLLVPHLVVVLVVSNLSNLSSNLSIVADEVVEPEEKLVGLLGETVAVVL